MKPSVNSNRLLKGILIGAGSAGVISLIPLVNLLNLFFMFWMAVGGAIGVHVYQRHFRQATLGEATLCGGLSGLLGGVIFAVFTYLTLQFVAPDSFERIILLLQKIMPSLQDETDTLLEAENFRGMLRTALFLAMGVSILVGMLGGLVTRWLYKPRKQKNMAEPGDE